MDTPDIHNGQMDKQTKKTCLSPFVRLFVCVLDGIWHIMQNVS